MKRYELEVEQQYKGKFVMRHRYTLQHGVVVVGQGRTAQIRLLGDDVSDIHCMLDCQDGVWTVIDAGSQHGTWVNKKPITSEVISKELQVQIGTHTLKLTPHVIEKEVFSPAAVMRNETQGQYTYHQMIIRRGTMVVRTELTHADLSFHFNLDGKDHTLLPPRMDEVIEAVYGPYTITQRLVKSDTLKLAAKDYLSGMAGAEMRTPLMVVCVMLLLLTALIVAIPEKPETELADLKPDNKYTRMIFDADMIKKKRAEAKEMRRTIMTSAKKSAEPAKNAAALTTPVSSKGATPKVVSQLKLEGLNALLGKIAKRANSKGPAIASFGKTADQPNTGPAVSMASVSSIQGKVTDMVGNGGSTYKVGAVGTLGKGGGNGRGLAGVSGLAAAGAGSGTVGILDEETEIEGGLDKEVIAKVIGNYLGEIRYCYERQLSAEPDIYGKVQVRFTIDAEGSVADHKIGTTTLKSAMVEGCILRRLARWKFPKPKGGTHVLVTYPFMFKSTN